MNLGKKKHYSINKSGSFNKNAGYRNLRSVWDIPTAPSDIPHYAMYPEKLVARMIEAGCPPDGVVLDPFTGAGQTVITAKKMGRQYIGIELYEKYCRIIEDRLRQEVLI